MSMLFFYETLAVVVTTVLAAVFAVSPLAKFDLQLVAVLFIFYVLFRKKLAQKSGFFILEAYVFIFIIVSVVFSTGGVRSQFFFLLYFLLFAGALVLEASTSLVLSLVLMIMFIATADYSMQLADLLPVLSLPFIAPFAKYLGDLQRHFFFQKQELLRLGKAKQRIEKTKIYQEEQTLIFLTTVLHRHLDDMKDRLENFLGDADLDYLKKKLKQLEELADKFKNYIEKI